MRANRVQCARIGRVLHEHLVAGAGERAQHQVQRVQGPLRHEHLSRLGRQPAT